MMKDEGNLWPAGSGAGQAQPALHRAEATTIANAQLTLLTSERGPRTLLQREDPSAGIASQRLADDDWAAPLMARDGCYTGLIIDNRYVVEGILATGGMGVVYKCRHKIIGKKLAVKVIRADMARLPEAPQRFLREAKAASSIGNEHIIDISDFGRLPDGSAYLVMELLGGIALSELVSELARLPLARIVSIATQVAEGLGAAHGAGIVHRDLKPENIFLLRRKSEDFVKILDFGIAKMQRPGGAHLTQAGFIVGTPHYMSPEQAAGSSIDHRSDIYALGVILYELATGHVPFDAPHYMEVLHKHSTEPPPPFKSITPAPSVPPEFEAIVIKCLSKRPEQRYGSMSELIHALQRLERRDAPAKSEAVRPREAHSVRPPAAGGSVPAAPSRSFIPMAKDRGRGLYVFGALLLLASLGSIWRLRDARLSTSRLGALPASGAPSAPPRALPSTLPSAPASAPMASRPSPAYAPAPPSTLPAYAPAPPSTLPAYAAPLPTWADATPASTETPITLGPDELAALPTVVELTDGRTVEIETRTRLSLKPKLGRAPTGVSKTKKPRLRPAAPASSQRQTARKKRAAAARAAELVQPWPKQ